MRNYGTGSADAVTDASGNVQPGVDLFVYRQDGTRVTSVWNHATEEFADHVTTDELGRPRFALEGDSTPLSLLLDFPDGTDPDERWVVLASDAFQYLESSALGALNLAEEALIGRSWSAGTPTRLRYDASQYWSGFVAHVLSDGTLLRSESRSTLRPGTPGNSSPESDIQRRTPGGTWATAFRLTRPGYGLFPVAMASHGATVLAAYDAYGESLPDRSLLARSTDGGETFTWADVLSLETSHVITDLYWLEGESDGTLYAAIDPRDGFGPQIWESLDAGANWTLAIDNDEEADSPYSGGSLLLIGGTWVWAAMEALPGGATNLVVRRGDSISELANAEWKRVLTASGTAPRLVELPDGALATPISMRDRNDAVGLAISRDRGASWIKSPMSAATSVDRGCVYIESDGVPHYVAVASTAGAPPTEIIDYPLLSGAVNAGGTVVCTSTTRPSADQLFVGQLIFETDTGALYNWTGTSFKYVQSDSTGWVRPFTLNSDNFMNFQSPGGAVGDNWGFIREGNYVSMNFRVVNKNAVTATAEGNWADQVIGQVTDSRFWPASDEHFMMVRSGVMASWCRLNRTGELIWVFGIPNTFYRAEDYWSVAGTFRALEAR